MKFEKILQHKVASIDGTPEEIADALNQLRAAACKRSISVDTYRKAGRLYRWTHQSQSRHLLTGYT